MSGIKIVTFGYLIPKVIAWVALFSVALFDAVKHRRIKRRGWQLQRALVAVVGGYVVQDVLLLAFVAVNNRDGSEAPALCGTYIFFTDLADTTMIVSPCCSSVSWDPRLKRM